MTPLSTSYTTWCRLQHASRHTVGARATLCPPRGSDGGMHTVFRSSGPKLGVSNVPNRSPRVAGLTHASVVTDSENGITREIRNFEHLCRHNLRPNYGTWRHTLRIWVLGRTREASPG
eukprot:scaffold6872_cov65-Phaeocystis_antarctica.AAC.1